MPTVHAPKQFNGAVCKPVSRGVCPLALATLAPAVYLPGGRGETPTDPAGYSRLPQPSAPAWGSSRSFCKSPLHHWLRRCAAQWNQCHSCRPSLRSRLSNLNCRWWLLCKHVAGFRVITSVSCLNPGCFQQLAGQVMLNHLFSLLFPIHQ